MSVAFLFWCKGIKKIIHCIDFIRNIFQKNSGKWLFAFIILKIKRKRFQIFCHKSSFAYKMDFSLSQCGFQKSAGQGLWKRCLACQKRWFSGTTIRDFVWIKFLVFELSADFFVKGWIWNFIISVLGWRKCWCFFEKWLLPYLECGSQA